MTARSEAARADIKERRKQIIEESSLEIAEERRFDEDIDVSTKPAVDEEGQSEKKSRGLVEDTEGDCSELSNWQPASEPKTLLKMPALDEVPNINRVSTNSLSPQAIACSLQSSHLTGICL